VDIPFYVFSMITINTLLLFISTLKKTTPKKEGFVHMRRVSCPWGNCAPAPPEASLSKEGDHQKFTSEQNKMNPSLLCAPGPLHSSHQYLPLLPLSNLYS